MSYYANTLLRRELTGYYGSEADINPDELEPRDAMITDIVTQAIDAISGFALSDGSSEIIEKAFQAVSQVLVDNDFKLDIPTDSLVEMFTLKVRPLSRDTYYPFDCDTGSFIFYSAFKELGYPVVMVESLRHNFVRWRLSDNEHINFDINDSAVYTDDEFRRGAPNTTSAFGKDAELARHYLLDMSEAEVEAYHYRLAARLAADNDNLDLAREYYLKSVQDRPYDSGAHNNLGLMISWRAYFDDVHFSADYLQLAVESAEKALLIEPDKILYISNLGVAYAAYGDFINAKKYWVRAVNEYNKKGLISKANEIQAWIDELTGSAKVIPMARKMSTFNIFVEKH